MNEEMQDALQLQAALDALRADGRGLVKFGMEYEVARIVRAAIAAQQPAQGEAACVLTIDNAGQHMSYEVGACSLPIGTHALYTAPPAPSVTVPEGWKLVPERLTPHMGHAGDATLDDDGSMQEMWTNILASAPEVTP